MRDGSLSPCGMLSKAEGSRAQTVSDDPEAGGRLGCALPRQGPGLAGLDRVVGDGGGRAREGAALDCGAPCGHREDLELKPA